MSNIFDALQRAEAESAGAESPGLLLAPELLQAAEQKMRGSALNVEQPPSFDTFEANPAAPASTEDLERCPVLPVSIREESRLVSVAEEGSLGAEKFRFLAVRLRQLRQNRPLKKVLITSTIPQEGKSTVAANLACTLARRKRHKTLLLEGDLRRPNITRQFGIGKIPGLCEWLSGQTESINLYQLESLGVWILPAGAAPENPLELMQSGKLSLLMERLEAWFDWIVIDSPPVLPLADASLWSRLADGILLVTRKGITEKQQLQRGLEAIEKSKLLGALVNGSSNVAHSDYYQRYSSSSAGQSKQ
ncbi:MAG: CpsD/CapB family tyrosine-protein kinase [Candidatus Sulfotelmatobacter sp.]|jgi:capsular exopolysaccharide synthesis family protein